MIFEDFFLTKIIQNGRHYARFCSEIPIFGGSGNFLLSLYVTDLMPETLFSNILEGKNIFCSIFLKITKNLKFSHWLACYFTPPSETVLSPIFGEWSKLYNALGDLEHRTIFPQLRFGKIVRFRDHLGAIIFTMAPLWAVNICILDYTPIYAGSMGRWKRSLLNVRHCRSFVYAGWIATSERVNGGVGYLMQLSMQVCPPTKTLYQGKKNIMKLIGLLCV